jgi:hypothetical protein
MLRWIVLGGRYATGRGRSIDAEKIVHGPSGFESACLRILRLRRPSPSGLKTKITLINGRYSSKASSEQQYSGIDIQVMAS